MHIIYVSLASQSIFAISTNSAFGHMLVIETGGIELGRTMLIIVTTRLTKWHILILKQEALNDVWFKGVSDESLALVVESLVYYWRCYRSFARMLTVVGCGSVEGTVAGISIPIIPRLLKFQILAQSGVEIHVFRLLLFVSKYVFQSFLEIDGLELG